MEMEVTTESGQELKEITNQEGNLESRKSAGAIGLKSIPSSGNLHGNSFNNLKYFYLNFCPKLSVVFPSSQRLENLEILEIKFCAELVSLFQGDSAELPRLLTLHLWELPKLNTVGALMPALRSLKYGECPILDVFSIKPLEETVKLDSAENYKSFK